MELEQDTKNLGYNYNIRKRDLNGFRWFTNL